MKAVHQVRLTMVHQGDINSTCKGCKLEACIMENFPLALPLEDNAGIHAMLTDLSLNSCLPMNIQIVKHSGPINRTLLGIYEVWIQGYTSSDRK
jgi:hypothetical protein